MISIRRLNKNDFRFFVKAFSEFEEDPFYEAWTMEEYVEEFLDFIENGLMYGLFDESEMCGLITIKEKYLKWNELDIDVEQSVYLSDIVVCKEYRRKGLGTKLMKYIVDSYGQDNDIYMRTNLENSQSEGIAKKEDFVVIPDKVQKVYFKRTRPDIPEVDYRKYLIRKRTNI